MQKTNQNSTTNMARRTFGAAFLLLFFGLPAGAQNNAAPDIYHLVSGNPQLGEDRREAIDTNPAPDDWEAQLEAITEGATPDIVSSEEAFTEIGDPAEPEPLQHAPQSFTLDRNGVPVPSAVTEAMEADVYTMEGLERTLGDVDEELGPGLEQIFRPDQRQEIYDPAAAAQRQAQEEAQDEWQVKEKIKETAEKMQSLPEYQVEQALQQELSLEEALTP
ncbi:MAG: hypothetical protein J6Y94_05730, partial [Bacteriovoracaceae bacterium]|nr:hypothetical protein [Bacteriovoracaceae bacterium]